MTTTTHSRVPNERPVMSYKFTPTHADGTVFTDEATSTYDNMAAFREAFAVTVPGMIVTDSKVYDEDNRQIGKLTWFKGDRAPRMVQPDPESTTTLEDVLADIDALELDDVRNDDIADDEPVIGAAERAGIPPLGVDEGKQGRQPRTPVAARVERGRHARMSHKDCGHAITGEEGKLARAACRAARRAAAA